MKIIKKDVIIVGSGLAGIYAALHIDSKLQVGLLSKGDYEQCNSNLAQGGVATCMSREDSFVDHIKDTMIAGAQHNDKEAVTLLVTQAPSEIKNLMQYGVEFDRDQDGSLLLTLEGGHSKRRILHADGDGTGRVIMDTLRKEISLRTNIEIHDKTMAIKIIKQKEKVQGIIALFRGELIFYQTKYIIIASGGIGALYDRTTNYSTSTGDGLILGHEAGCHLVDPCFVQFHPTGFYEEDAESIHLISEAVRGEGGCLLNKELKGFMQEIDHRADLAPRDIVARGIFEQMKQDDSDHVWLDIRFRGKEFLQRRFPNIYGHLREKELKMEEDLIPVVPVAHYYVGGIKTDIDARTTQLGIYACGEVSATGVHGANRLASNSLLECLVFGKRAAKDINSLCKDTVQEEGKIEEFIEEDQQGFQELLIDYERELQGTFLYPKQKEELRLLQKEIRRMMTRYAGIIRANDELTVGLKLVQGMYSIIHGYKAIDQDYFETLHMVKVAEIVIQDAMVKESLGCHYKQEKYCEVHV